MKLKQYNHSVRQNEPSGRSQFAVNEKQFQDIHQEQLEAILANAVDAIITIDEHGFIKSVNPATQKMFGYRPDEIMDQNINVLMPQPFHDEHDQYIRNYLESGEKKIIGIGREVSGQRKDGTVFPIHLAVSEIRIDDHWYFTGIIRDISDVKRVEAKLVQNERLAAIGQMMAGLAHESRNAFQRSHACLTNLAFDVREMPESLELVHKVQNALDNLNALLDEVRDYAAPIVLEKSPTHLEALIRDTWQQIVTANAESANIQFAIHRSQDFPERIKIDRVRIGQVIWNLLENARSACNSADGEIRIELEKYDDPNRVVVEVHDNGAGLSAESTEHIFEPFFTTKTKGTGLGLAICRRIVNAHDGQLTARNRSPNGATFRLQLPVIE